MLTTTDDRVGLNAFIAGTSPFYATGPNLARQVKDQNATLYGNLGMVPQPLGKSNVSGKGLMSISVKKRHQVPQRLHGARAVLHQPAGHGGVQQAGPVYPSSAKRSKTRSSRRRRRRSRTAPGRWPVGSSRRTPTSCRRSPSKADVNEIVRKAIESALFGGVDAKTALSDAVAQANALIK